MTRKYEVIYILDPTNGEDALNATSERIKALIESAGTIDNIDEWGQRRLAYEIDDRKEGFYVLIDFTADAEFPRELERVLRITDGVLRCLVIGKDD